MVVGEGGSWGLSLFPETAAEPMNITDNNKICLCTVHFHGVIRRQAIDRWLKSDTEDHFYVRNLHCFKRGLEEAGCGQQCNLKTVLPP